ncbi:exosortase F-associated protein [Kordia sp. SMS9]|uniref:exosortase F system-associated membrane protein n=1 Tax=Kordia sp. SMS9 TaxID=2282170 RepID=UPI000E0D28B3|nr:exosortase F system-associated protein [Kordia sp. SMS9]AXG68262.1 exosortase F-associated protein [Kordia sp. SMS9]
MGKVWKYIAIGFLFAVLVLIRAFENELFYDPFLLFFKYDYFQGTIPEYETWSLFLNYIFRYGLNMLVSLAIIYIAFENKSVVKFSLGLYAIAFVILVSLYFYLIKHDLTEDYLLTFYVRRFLIQPLFVLILLPAFYYQRKIKHEEF